MEAQSIPSTDQRHESESQETLGRSTRDESERGSFQKATRIRKTSSDGSPGHHVLQRANSELPTAARRDIKETLQNEEDENNSQNVDNDARVMVSFTRNDPGNPVNWSSVRLEYPNSIWSSDKLQEQKNLHSGRRDCSSDQQHFRLVIAEWCDNLSRAVLQRNESTTTSTSHLSVSGWICPWSIAFRPSK